MADRYLEDGERRVMKPGAYLGSQRNDVKVIAERVDSETPFVILEFEGVECYMTDSLAEDVMKRIKRALSILPTSK